MSITAMKLALAALGPTAPECCGCRAEWEIAIEVLQKAIESPQPAQKPLTDEELGNVLGFGEHTTPSTRATLTHLARAIESAHGIKGETK